MTLAEAIAARPLSPHDGLRRSFDAGYLNALVNHPVIRPEVGGDGSSYLDLSAMVADDKNYLLHGPAGGFLATWCAPFTYEIHTFILPEGRGRAAFQLAHEGREYMEREGAEVLFTRVMRSARHVRLFTLKAGFEPCGDQVLDLGGGPVLYDLYRWSR